MNGENYLVPMDEAGPVKSRASTQLRMVILDACRSSPFRMVSLDGRPRAVGRGLSPVEPGGGVLVAFAARDGAIADDGTAANNPFTQALLANLETPCLDIRIMFGKVRDQVLARTNNTQEPFTYGLLPGEEFYFQQAAGR
jgi:uncharacterized caspase-like protein